MAITTRIRRPLGTMIVHGFARLDVGVDLAIAARLGAEVVEILPDWRALPDPDQLRGRVEDAGLKVHSAHGCWGGHSIRASRVDLGSLDDRTWASSVADLLACVDWVHAAGGTCLVVHPGGLSDPEDAPSRRKVLIEGLTILEDHATRLGLTICVENLPPGVHPGSRMADLRQIVDEIGRPGVALALDTGHAQISDSAASETLEAGSRLQTTHVHDNDGRQDVHWPPGQGSIDWGKWVEALDAIDYRGPIILECIKHLRDKPESITPQFQGQLRQMCGLERS